MKFIHTADWHLGKLVHGLYMTEDQAYILEQFTELVKHEEPDAIVIAGDLYDRSVPPTDAVNLLNDVLFTLNVELKIPIVAIAGNHDSAERLSFGSSWYRHTHFYLEGKLPNAFQPVHIKGVNFFLVPYAEPATVREVIGNPAIATHDEAMKAIIQQIEPSLSSDQPNVLVGHAFVTGGQSSDSERTLSVGGAEHVSAENFAPFAYTALGHLHHPHAISHPTVHYAGSLLKYSFSEAGHKKSVSIVEIDEKGVAHRTERFLKPKRDMREIEGYLDELLDPQYYKNQKTEDYLKVSLLDEGTLHDPIQKLRHVYPNVLHLERKVEWMDAKQKQIYQTVQQNKMSEVELFEIFYQEMTTATFSAEKKKWLEQVIDEVKKKESVTL
ncbi:exonuclease SbcCD subunit D [Bacillus litorisediminis]|uniref:exonuclease SbcCD subunit D n=1 Tax=Bacillus litorisediminis TaxID=2922713 RepID=UPI001FAC0C41|nr:exonuclease SbcCD subunit D [Bacillus litorisediminis]